MDFDPRRGTGGLDHIKGIPEKPNILPHLIVTLLGIGEQKEDSVAGDVLE